MARYSKAYRSRDEGTTSVARVYADINDKRPAEYWDYENLQVSVGGQHMQQQSLVALCCCPVFTADTGLCWLAFPSSGEIKTTTRWSAKSAGASTVKSLRCAWCSRGRHAAAAQQLCPTAQIAYTSSKPQHQQVGHSNQGSVLLLAYGKPFHCGGQHVAAADAQQVLCVIPPLSKPVAARAGRAGLVQQSRLP